MSRFKLLKTVNASQARTDYQPITDYWSPITTYQLPLTSFPLTTQLTYKPRGSTITTSSLTTTTAPAGSPFLLRTNFLGVTTTGQSESFFRFE